MSEDIQNIWASARFALHTAPPLVGPAHFAPIPSRMATAAPVQHEVNEVEVLNEVNEANEEATVKSNDDSERGGSSMPADMMEQQQQQQHAGSRQNSTPAHFPLSTQEQLQAMARRREAAVCFKYQVEECRLALRYSVIGWTGTLDPAKIPAALTNAPSIRDLDRQMDTLQHKLAPFLPPDANNAPNPNNPATSFQGLGPQSLQALHETRELLLSAAPGAKPTRHIGPVLRLIEQRARAAGILPPEDNLGWVWSLSYDDWFIWHAGEEEFVSARHDIRTDFVAA